MDGLRREVEDLRQRSKDQQRRLMRLEALRYTSHVVAQPRACFYCHQRAHVRRDYVALQRTQRNNAGKEAEYIRSLRCQLIELRRQLEHEQSLRMRLEARTRQVETRSADERRKRITESCNEYVRLSSGETDCIDEDIPEMVQLRRRLQHERHPRERLEVKTSQREMQHAEERRKRITESCDEYVRLSIGDTERVDGDILGTVELGGRLDHERHPCVRLEEQTTQGETLHTDKRKNRYNESSDEGISVSTGDTDDVDEKES